MPKIIASLISSFPLLSEPNEM